MQYFWKNAKVIGTDIIYTWKPVNVLSENKTSITFEKFEGGELKLSRRLVARKIELGEIKVSHD